MSDPRDNVQQEFLAEAQELVEALSRDLLFLDEAHHRGERIDPALINEIFRSVHTLKGIAGMFGYKHVGAVAHALEDLLGRFAAGPHPRRLAAARPALRLGRALSAALGARRSAVARRRARRAGLHRCHPFDWRRRPRRRKATRSTSTRSSRPFFRC